MDYIGCGIHRVVKDAKAWNVDGSSSDRASGGLSWIRYWEEKTGMNRAVCSYLHCNRSATVGGHIWICRKGTFIAPICSGCNFSENENRMQDAESRLRSGTLVVEAEYTEDMANADRRFAQYRYHSSEEGSDIGCEGDSPDVEDSFMGCESASSADSYLGSEGYFSDSLDSYM